MTEPGDPPLPSTPEEQLFHFSSTNQANKITTLFHLFPSLQINSTHQRFQITSLHAACQHDHVEVVHVLLQHPKIDPNARNSEGDSVFLTACACNSHRAVRAMLQNPLIAPFLEIDSLSSAGTTPLWCASFWGCWEVVLELIASGRKADISWKAKGTVHAGLDCVAIADRKGHVALGRLLEEWRQDPLKARIKAMLSLGMIDLLAAEVFASVLFLCDGIFQVIPSKENLLKENPPENRKEMNIESKGENKKEKEKETESEAEATITQEEPEEPEAFEKESEKEKEREKDEKEMERRKIRFFRMIERLPMELQMMTCHRLFGSSKDQISSADCEKALRALALAVS